MYASKNALASNVMQFIRILRYAGLPLGPGKSLLAVQALATINLRNRGDFYWALHAVCVECHSQSDLFCMAFERFWTARSSEESLFDSYSSSLESEGQKESKALSRRLAQALVRAGLASEELCDSSMLNFDSRDTWSEVEHLRSADFETMSLDEQALTKWAMRNFRFPIPEAPNRRFRMYPTGRRIDMRATLRSAVRTGDFIDLKRKKRLLRCPPLVILCDISGSMESYSRILLHFFYGVTNGRDRVHTFLFGTRLTNVSHHLMHTDPDIALGRVAYAVEDWSGGTRIGETLAQFNRKWSRRVLGQGATVLLITDGLDRDGGARLSDEMARLQKSCRQLIWLNPLLRYDAFEPKSLSIRQMLPHVDDFRAAHNLDSLNSLIDVLASTPHRSRKSANQMFAVRNRI